MKTYFSMLVRIIASLVFFSSFAYAQMNSPVEKKIGDTCSYQTVDGWTSLEEYRFTWEFVGVSEDGYEVIERFAKTGKYSVLKMDRDFNIKEISGGIKYDSSSGHYSFPLFVGKDWEIKTGFSSSSAQGTYLIAGKVLAEERVIVPAGTFSTVKIELKGRVSMMFKNSQQEWTEMRMVWYIPELGCFAKRSLVIRGRDGRVIRSAVTELQAYVVK